MKSNLPSLSIMVLFLFAFSSIATAQPKTEKNSPYELSIGIGNWSPVQLWEGKHLGMDAYNEYLITNFNGIFTISCRYFFSRKFYIGCAIAIENESGDMQTSDSYNGIVATGKFKRNVYSIAPEIGLDYSKSRVKYNIIYGYLGLGYSYLNEVDIYSLDYYNSRYNNGINSLGNNVQESNNRLRWTGQFCPIGVRFGSRLRGQAELGYGYKGILNFGLSFGL